MQRVLMLAVASILSAACLMPRSASFGERRCRSPPAPSRWGSPRAWCSRGATARDSRRRQHHQRADQPLLRAAQRRGEHRARAVRHRRAQPAPVPGGRAAGRQLAVSRSSLSLAVMPELGLGYWSRGGSNLRTQGATQTSTDLAGTSSVGLLLGAKVLASLSSGLYAGGGYAYQQISTSNTGPSAGNRGNVSVSHAFSMALGWELGGGAVKVRPELALMILPVVGGWNTNGNTALGPARARSSSSSPTSPSPCSRRTPPRPPQLKGCSQRSSRHPRSSPLPDWHSGPREGRRSALPCRKPQHSTSPRS